MSAQEKIATALQASQFTAEQAESLAQELYGFVAHELAERIRNGNPDRTPDWSDGVDWAADLIDPEVSTDVRS